jgi:DNA-binding ferritin-like protein
VKGDPHYGDHLLFERLYTEVVEEIDGLGEKVTSYYGPEAIEDLATLVDTTRFLSLYQGPGDGPTGLYERALRLELHLQRSLKVAYDRIKVDGEMSLGLDDYLMSLANTHESHVYLLRQRLR